MVVSGLLHSLIKGTAVASGQGFDFEESRFGTYSQTNPFKISQTDEEKPSPEVHRK